MFGYYLDLAWRSLKRTPILSGLMVLAIGLGIGASMTMITVLHVMTGDPLPGRSAHLYYPHINPLPLDYHLSRRFPDPSDDMSWPDAMALLHAHRAVRQAAMAGGRLVVHPGRPDLQPFYIDGEYTTSDFFSMFGVPFVAGSGWSATGDQDGARVVVLTQTLVHKLFGARNPIGQTVQFADPKNTLHGFRVVGVVSDWAPVPQFYADKTRSIFNEPDQFFLPLSAAVDLDLGVRGNQSGWRPVKSPKSTQAKVPFKKRPNSSWLQFWVQLDTPAQVKAYHQFLINYSAKQKALGRFQRPSTDARLYTLMGWLRHENLVPSDVRLQFWLAIGFLGVAMLNIVALLLAKFLRRAGEISVRRAMGARKLDIFFQFGIESALIGVAGGLLGLGIAQLGLWTVRQRPDGYARLAMMDPAMLVATVGLAIVVSVAAGLLPAWRACRVPPAIQLKTL